MKYFAYCISIALIVGCTKDRQMYHPLNYNAVNSSASAFQTATVLVDLIDTIQNMPASSASFSGVNFEKTIDGDSIRLQMDFGDTTTVDPDQRYRGGIVHVVYPQIFQSTGAVTAIKIDSLYVNGIRYSGYCELTYEFASQGYVIYKWHASNLHHRIFDKDVMMSCDLFMRTYGLYQPCWTRGGIQCGGDLNYQVSVQDSIYYDQLSKCYERGKCNLSTNDFDALINYGDGQHDKLATATSEEFRYILQLENF